MKIAFLGDSITYGYALDDPSKKYTTLVCRALDAKEENYGITGTLIAKAGLNRSDGKDFISRVALVDDADVAVIFGGTNDYFWSDRPIEGEADDCYFARALDTIMTHIKMARQDKLTLFVTPYPHNGIGNFLGGASWNTSSRHDTDTRNFNGHMLADYVEAIESACHRHGFPCLNLHKGFDLDWHVHTVDGCHPNPMGHQLLADVIAEKLQALLQKQ